MNAKAFIAIEAIIFAIFLIGLLLMLGGVVATPENKTVGELILQGTKADYPEPSNYVVDTTGEMSPDVVANLNFELSKFDGTAQIAVLVIDSTFPQTIEEYSINLAEKWKVGYSGKDNGIIIVLATKDRKVRIEVGKGLEGTIPDAVAGRIMDEYMVPDLKNNDWDAAITKGVRALEARLTK